MTFFQHDLKADDIDVDTPERAKELAQEYSVAIHDDDNKYFQCQLVIIDFPSIRNEMGIQTVQLLTYEPNGKISTKLRVHSSPPPRNPQPELTEDSRDRTYLCISKEQKSKLVNLR